MYVRDLFATFKLSLTFFEFSLICFSKVSFHLMYNFMISLVVAECIRPVKEDKCKDTGITASYPVAARTEAAAMRLTTCKTFHALTHFPQVAHFLQTAFLAAGPSWSPSSSSPCSCFLFPAGARFACSSSSYTTASRGRVLKF